MFVKPFRTKSNVAIKGSDRKRLRSDFKNAFPESVDDEDLKELVPAKEEMTVMKIYSYKGENVLVYCLKKNPVAFEREGVLHPTMYTAWKFPTLLSCITTQPQVINRLLSGADLMLPGVIVPKTGLPQVCKGQVIGINALGNKAPLAVGCALLSSRDMIEAGMRGKGVKVLHTFGDHLWMIGDKQQPPEIPVNEHSMEDDPENGDTVELTQEEYVDHFMDGDGEIDDAEQRGASDPETPPSDELQKLSLEHATSSNKEGNEEDSRTEAEIMDEILHLSFMTALKQRLKDSELPILTSTFYRTHVLPCCPPDQFLDIKKSSYKKLSKYLRHVAANGLIQVKELSKGNDNLISVARSHPDLRSFKPLIVFEPEPESDSSNTVSSFGVITQKQYEPPEISVVHSVSAVSLPLFSTLGYKKGSTMTLPEIRESVTKYIRENDLVRPEAPSVVTLDPLLHRAMFDKAGNNILSATWEDVFKKVISKLQPCHQLKFKGMDPVIKTGGTPSIKVSVQQRAGNKKVTIVESLEGFMIEPQQFADAMRRKAQASTSLMNIVAGGSHKATQQVLIQGNQVTIVENLLTGPEYRIPRRYLKGLENAPKAKKKGK